MTFFEATNYLFAQLPMYHKVGSLAYKPGLQNINLLCKNLGMPQNKFKCIHIAGTNGKGSVSHLLASVLFENGYKTGLYTSPHLIDFRERIRINGEKIPEAKVVEFVKNVKPLIEQHRLSFFEVTTAMAFNFFASENIDIAVIETGLGGRLDATNIVLPQISVITNVSIDHTDLLGNTIAEIACEKAGIIKQNIPLVIGETNIEAQNIFIAEAINKCSQYVLAQNKISIKNYTIIPNGIDIIIEYNNNNTKYELGLAGIYQLQNIKTVLATLLELKQNGTNINNTAIFNGLKNVVENTNLLGRWQRLNENPTIICDTGHNQAGIEMVVNQLKLHKYNNLYVIFGLVNDKDRSNILKLLPQHAHYIFTKANIPRSLQPNILLNEATSFGLKGECVINVWEAIVLALKKAQGNDLIFIGGSTFVVAEAIAYFNGAYLE